MDGPGLRRQLAAISVSIALLTGVAAVRAQTPASADGALAIGGDVSRPMTIKVEDLKKMPRTTVVVSEEGREVKYEGVLVAELLNQAGGPVGGDLNGKALATYVLASAKDGYQVAFSIGELDQVLTSNDIIIADTIDGKPLFDYQGPLRVVAPHDKRGA